MTAILLEGPDGTGKTTLAQELVKRGYKLHHHHHRDFDPKLSAYEYYTKLLLDARGKKVVFDRLYPSELVYGPVMRKGSKITVSELRILNRLLYADGGTIIFCDTDDEAIEKNFLARWDKEYVDGVDKLRQVIMSYRELMTNEFWATKHTFNYLNNSAERFAQQRCGIKSFDSCFDGVWGSPSNRFLVVGEKPGKNCSYDRAFCGMDGSAGFLNHCLWDAGYFEHEVAFTNAITLNAIKRDLRSVWLRQPEQVVIALGSVAKMRCIAQGVPHLPAEHPQYIKRFQSKRRGQYVELLRQFREGK